MDVSSTVVNDVDVKPSKEGNVTAALGAAIRAARLQRGISQEGLADLCELDRTYISGIERGVRNPTVRTLWRIAAALKLAPSTFVREAERALGAQAGRNAP